MKYLNNNHGFTLVAALMTLVLLVAVSTIVFIVTTKNFRIASRIIAEKKAFSGVEAGINQLRYYSEINGGSIAGYSVTNQSFGTDPYTLYSISDPLSGAPTNYPKKRDMAGYSISGGQTWGQLVTAKTVTGTNTRYQSRVDVDVGVGYGPVDISTLYR
jgi:type II secretory pathway pseudopilin PulG